jgi:hypothetical protein
MALALTQVAVHGALWLGGSHGVHGGAGPTSALASTPSVHGPTMLLWHAVAVAVSSVLLRHGERLVHLFARLVRTATGEAPMLLPPAGPRPRPLTSPRAIVLLPRALLIGVAERRGPPLLLTAS